MLAPPSSPLSVGAVHRDAVEVNVALGQRVSLLACHKALILAFTECKPAHDCSVVVEPHMVTSDEMSPTDRPTVLSQSMSLVH